MTREPAALRIHVGAFALNEASPAPATRGKRRLGLAPLRQIPSICG